MYQNVQIFTDFTKLYEKVYYITVILNAFYVKEFAPPKEV